VIPAKDAALGLALWWPAIRVWAKVAALRLLTEHLNGLRDLCVGILPRPQAKMADSDRELGHPLAQQSMA
jgi:hypothetical protein